MLKLIGFLTGGGWVPLAIALAIGVVGAGSAAGYGAYKYEHAFVTAAEAKQQLAEGERDNVKAMLVYTAKDRDAIAAVATKQQAEMDAMDAKARAIQSDQAGQVLQLAEERRAAQNRTQSALAALRGPDVQITASVSSLVKTGFDPRIVLGLAWLRCLQDARAHGAGPDTCAGRLSAAAGGPGAAGGAAGAERWAPTFDDQLWLLGLVYQFRDWGLSCYDDKRAIAASQKAEPKVGS